MNRVTQYANDVLNEKVITGELVKLACKRHIEDLKREGTEEFPYFFNVQKANDIIEFAETLKLAEGEEEYRGQALKLAPFQAFILGSLFGWVHKDTEYRRYRTSYIQLGRQNGKSLLNGIIALYCCGFTGYKYGQIYLTATKQAQAKIVYNEINKFLYEDKELEELFDIKEYESTITSLYTNTKIKALGRDTKSIDGFRPYLGIVDEYHAHKDSQMYKLLEDGAVKLNQSLISVITTAGFELTYPCKDLYDYCCNLLKCVFDNETQFVYIAQMDKDDDIWDEKNWIKANPLVVLNN